MMSKGEIRARYKAKRMALPAAFVAEADQQILHLLQQERWFGMTYLHVFLPIARWKEFDTRPFVYWLQKQHPRIRIVLSKMDMEQSTLQHYVWKGEDELRVNAWGIPEIVHTAQAEAVQPLQMDYILVPLLVCDGKGQRIGYGKGFYDRFLKDCRPDCQKVGVSYFPLLADDLPADTWDVALDRLITPAGVTRFTPEDK